MAKIKCIDVSEHQGVINWVKVKESGIDYAILRAGFGRTSVDQTDETFESNYKNAKAAGLKLGAYWYSYADSTQDAKREAEACLTVLKGKKLDLPVFYDMEESFQTAYGKSMLTNMAKMFCETIKAGGFTPGVYANLTWFENYLDYNSLKKLYPIWLAQYHTEAQLGCDIWQYSSEGSVPGVCGDVDMNIIYNAEIIIGTGSKEVTEKVSYETGCLQALLMIAERLGIISQTISPLDNKKGKMTKAAILQMKNHLKLKEDYTVDLTFIRKTYQAIVDALSVVGDINGDGKVNIRDATALQKELAGIED